MSGDARPSWKRGLLHLLAATLIVDVAVLGVLGVLAIAFENDWFLNEPVVGALFAVAAYTAISLAAAGVMRRGTAVRRMVAAIVLAAAALGLNLRLIFEDDFYWQYEEAALRLIGLCTVGAILLVYDAGLLRFRFTLATGRWLQSGVRITAQCFAGVIVLLILAGEYVVSRSLIVLQVAIPPLLVTTGLGTLIGPLVVRSAHQRERQRFARADASLQRDLTLSMACPRCDADMQVRRGPGRCDACNFTMHLEIEEPRCECGYLIYEHTSTRCPECGRDIPESDRWQEVGGHEP